ncbi:MAG: hypothetical protein K6E53_13015 [Lachnospiraceae bacterium]|nr:hypothetical protein [Lachnospiraceae bacterium]
MYEVKVGEGNNLKNEIERIVNLCNEYDKKYEGSYSNFGKPVKETEISKWESEHGIKIPDDYKDWLRFSGRCEITQNTAIFRSPEEFVTEYVSDDLVCIGDLLGDGERIFFSKYTGEFVELYESEEYKVKSFKDILHRLIGILEGAPILTADRYNEILDRTMESGDVQLKEEVYAFIKLLSTGDNDSYYSFNDLNGDDRRLILGYLTKSEVRELVSNLRNRAVKDFWTHERELLKQGKCTRRWNPVQYESIMNISKETGNTAETGGIAKDVNGRIYYGRHMYNTYGKPEYAGDWRNVQALTYTEYFEGVFKMRK